MDMSENQDGDGLFWNTSDSEPMYNVSVANFTANTSPVANQMPWDRQPWSCTLYDFIIEVMFMGLLCMFGFVGNTLSMICLWKDKSKTATPFLLISLEIADTLFLVTVVMLRVLTSIHQFTGWFKSFAAIFPYVVSYVYPCAQLAMMCTNYSTILVTINRYISVCRPYEASNLCSIRQARKQVALVWIFCILFNIPRFFEVHVDTVIDSVTGEARTRSFSTKLYRNQVYQYLYASAMYFIFIFLIPLVSLILLNYKLICALRETQKRRAKLLTHDSHNHSEDDITLTLIVVVLVFLVTQTPALITQILLSSLPRETEDCPKPLFYYIRISDLLIVANSASNFIIYCFCSRRFRQILITFVCKQKLGSPENSVANNAAHAVKHYKPVALKEEKDTNGHHEVTAV